MYWTPPELDELPVMATEESEGWMQMSPEEDLLRPTVLFTPVGREREGERGKQQKGSSNSVKNPFEWMDAWIGVGSAFISLSRTASSPHTQLQQPHKPSM